MGTFSVILPDVGEGIAEAELVEWAVKLGDIVAEDDLLAAVMTDKATVEIPSAVSGTVVWMGAEIGDTIAVGSELVRLEVAGEGNVAPGSRPGEERTDSPTGRPADRPAPGISNRDLTPASVVSPALPNAPRSGTERRDAQPTAGARFHGAGPVRPEGEKPLASPSVRHRAREAGIDLRQVRGSGPAGRITHEDMDAVFKQESASPVLAGLAPDTSVTEVKVLGLRRRIAERMALSKSRIPHITIVEEVDVTALEELRVKLNARLSEGDGRAKLTVLPFLMRALVRATREQPGLNAHFDDDEGIVRQFGGVHIGVAAQTPNGLMVPVVRHCEARDLWDLAGEVARLASAAREGTASREDLTGSTITITSLGALGALATTPIINHPEVAIVGVNRMAVRPVWSGTDFVPRKMMNLSSSFDHRVVDGWDAAVFVQRLKNLMETPAMIFMED